MHKLWYGEAEVLGYPLSVLAETEAEVKRALLKEHRAWHRNAKTGIRARSWQHLSELTEASIREMELGKVWQP
jgi:hypothetical protein